jgi:hypothetical protein
MQGNCTKAVAAILLCRQEVFPERTLGYKLRGAAKDRVRRNLPRVSVALKRSVLVGCGARLGHLYRLTPRSLHDLANAMPMPACAYRVSDRWQASGK